MEKKYVGQTRDFHKRKQEHIRALKNGKHKNIYFLRSFEIYGIENFSFYIIELCTIEELNEKEIYWIKFYNSEDRDFGYNLVSGGLIGRIMSDETKEKIRNKKLGKRATEETKKKFSEMKKGEKNSFFGKKHTEESRKKISEHHADVSGENHPLYGVGHTLETRKKMSDSAKGKEISLETREKLRQINLGKKVPLGKKFGKSKYQGVSWNSTIKKWKVEFEIHKERYYIGYFSDELDAAKAYNKYITENNLDRPLNYLGD